jgi:hypothetical protein
MKGTSASRAIREAETGIEVPRWEVRTLINLLGRGGHGQCFLHETRTSARRVFQQSLLIVADQSRFASSLASQTGRP